MIWQPSVAAFAKSVAIVFLAATVGFVGRGYSQDLEPAPTRDQPLLELDVHKFGYEPFTSGDMRWQTFVDFTDDNHLAVAWLTPDNPMSAKKTRMATPQPAHLNVLILDAVTGEKKGQQTWSTPSFPVRFLGGRDGQFITCTGNDLRLYSPTFEVLRKQQLQNELGCLTPSLWGAPGVSPSRRSLLLSSRAGYSFQITLLNFETFALIDNWTQKRTPIDISDHWLVGQCDEPEGLCIRGMTRGWQPFKPVVLGGKLDKYTNKSPRFVDDQTLVIHANNEMAVVSVDGTVLFQRKLPEKHTFGTLVTSSRGGRFAIIENRQRGLTNEPLDMYAFPSNDRAVVYSIPDRRPIYAVKLNGTSPWSPWDPHVNQLALSPDGTLLAVVSSLTLKVYRLPKN